MFRSFAAMLVTFVLYAPPAFAQDTLHAMCVGYRWNFLPDSSVPLYGVMLQFQTLTHAIRGTLARDTQQPAVEIRAADCPLYEDDPYLWKLSAEKKIAGAVLPASYGVYASIGYFRGSSLSDLVREGRKLACLMREHALNDDKYDLYQPVPETALRCMLEEARKAGDADYARWLSRTVAPEKQQVGLNGK